MEVIDLRPAFPPDHYGDRTRPPRAFVLHHTDTLHPAATRQTLLDRGLSTHAEVTREGDVLLYLDPAEAVAWHAGADNNADSIGIDFTHRVGQDWPEEQLAAGRWLLRRWGADFDIPRILSPDRCSIGPDGPCLELIRAPGLIRDGYGAVRHRNVAATICPDTLPAEELFAPSAEGGGFLAAATPLLAVGAGVLLARAMRRARRRR